MFLSKRAWAFVAIIYFYITNGYAAQKPPYYVLDVRMNFLKIAYDHERQMEDCEKESLTKGIDLKSCQSTLEKTFQEKIRSFPKTKTFLDRAGKEEVTLDNYQQVCQRSRLLPGQTCEYELIKHMEQVALDKIIAGIHPYWAMRSDTPDSKYSGLQEKEREDLRFLETLYQDRVFANEHKAYVYFDGMVWCRAEWGRPACDIKKTYKAPTGYHFCQLESAHEDERKGGEITWKVGYDQNYKHDNKINSYTVKVYAEGGDFTNQYSSSAKVSKVLFSIIAPILNPTERRIIGCRVDKTVKPNPNDKPEEKRPSNLRYQLFRNIEYSGCGRWGDYPMFTFPSKKECQLKIKDLMSNNPNEAYCCKKEKKSTQYRRFE